MMGNTEIEIKKAPFEMKNQVFNRLGVSTRTKRKRDLLFSIAFVFLASMFGIVFMKFNTDVVTDQSVNVASDNQTDYAENIEEVEEDIDDTLDSLDTLLVMLDEEEDLDLDLDE